MRFGIALAICASGLIVAACAPKFNHQGTTSDDTSVCSVESPGTSLTCPTSVSVDSEGSTANNVVISGTGNNQIQVVCNPGGSTQNGLCSHVSGSLISTSGSAGTVGTIYTLAGRGWPVNSGDGQSAASTAGMYQPGPTAVDSAGNVVIAVPTYHEVRVVCMNTSGVCVGTDGSGSIQSGGSSVTAGDIYRIAGNQISYADTDNALHSTNSGFNDLSVNSMTSTNVTTNGVAGYSAALNHPDGVAVDKYDNVIIADTNDNAVRAVCLNPNASDVFCTSGTVTAGDIYTIAGGGSTTQDGTQTGLAGTAAAITNPISVTVDNSTNNIAIADKNSYYMLCGSTSGLCGQVAAGTGSVGTTAGSGATGDIYYVAATDSSGNNGVGFDSAGDLMLSDPQNAEVRVVCASTSGSNFCAHTNGSSLIDSSGSAGSVGATYLIASSSNSYSTSGYASSNGYLAEQPAAAGLSYPMAAMGYGGDTTHTNELMVVDRDNDMVRFVFY